MADPPRSENMPAGYDEESPYEGEDLSEYPDWWRKNIKEFQQYELRPYRPPRFTDGTYTPPVIKELEAELDIGIELRALNPSEGDSWQIEIDGKPVAEIGKERTGEGFTRYAMTANKFKIIVRSVVTERE
jgi:hypothetical protein